MQTEGLTLRLVFHVDVLQFDIHHFRECIRLFLRNLLVLKLEIEMVFRLLHICKSNEELGLDTRLGFGLMNGVHELRLIQLLAGERNNTVHLGYHVYRRRVLVESAYFHQVVHVVSEQTRIGRHVRTVTLT